MKKWSEAKKDHTETQETSNDASKIFSKMGMDKWLLLLLAGVLLVLSSFPKKDTKENITQTQKQEEIMIEETDGDYAKKLEQRLKNILETVDGAGNVEVMITLQSTEKQQVAKQENRTQKEVEESDEQGGKRSTTESTTEEEKIYTTNEDGEEVPFVETKLMPEVEGAVIVAQGGEEPQIAERLVKAAQAVLGVDVNKIIVCKMR